jgi:uncharacterized protein (TIGR02452 family)
MAEIGAPSTLKAEHAAKEKVGKGFVKVRDGDVLYVAGQLVLGEDKKVCVLNMACAVHPGGGVAGGKAAQEEDLHRRADIPPHALG